MLFKPGSRDTIPINGKLPRSPKELKPVKVKTHKKIIAFDLNEVAPGSSDDWDANVGARALWNLVCATEKSRRNHLAL